MVAETFHRHFFQAGGQFPPKDFRAPEWIHSSPGNGPWWYRITEYVLAENSDLRGSDLYRAIRATQHGLKINAPQLQSILELYCPDSGTFFTPNRELGLPLHEMYEVSGLPLGEFTYEEYVPGQQEIDRLSDQSPQVVETLWELLCHFHICLDTLGSMYLKGKKKRTSGISHKNWADYLFLHNNDKRRPVLPLIECDSSEIGRRTSENGDSETLECNERGFRVETTFESFHHQSGSAISTKALLA